MSTSPDVRSARRDEIGPLSHTLAAAFHEDPVSVWLWPDPERRAAGLPRFFGAMTRHHHFATGGVDIALDGSGAIGGAALWNPPGRWHHSTLSELLMLPQFARAMGTRLLAGKRMGDTITARHPHEPHWYLAVIGSDPAQRGRGYGHALLRARLDHCDREQVPAYLESSNESNIGYYERFGFEVTDTITTPDDGPTLWAMWRRPRSGS
ncbi:GNAT family N-acetyltransferase [Nocardia cyriacigeorgica]|uniref:GNAT family N-acetyltransferase n=1 Tax=Nocardia cyriacigeorgica TaxID=135487 RepID=A0A6P1DA99_9NOCA|nr:GNAT family N-acetyltransferase [Nocardia cyriacigeorgica]NEW39952.1 GNAT family N-acetyltransferase [Nocardia cyriacigeorgica]NEW45232.1 GNAT family N-acetyltransferase [Nocardia cyriacigeorgica]NEW51435.1 GNAT family N-acetyltransferase [Nocardia cyriacigeorgica]NEW55329.1 GNAT family N-acetyltransferase [Nocardia cyriacigeorgica]